MVKAQICQTPHNSKYEQVKIDLNSDSDSKLQHNDAEFSDSRNYCFDHEQISQELENFNLVP